MLVIFGLGEIVLVVGNGGMVVWRYWGLEKENKRAAYVLRAVVRLDGLEYVFWLRLVLMMEVHTYFVMK